MVVQWQEPYAPVLPLSRMVETGKPPLFQARLPAGLSTDVPRTWLVWAAKQDQGGSGCNAHWDKGEGLTSCLCSWFSLNKESLQNAEAPLPFMICPWSHIVTPPPYRTSQSSHAFARSQGGLCPPSAREATLEDPPVGWEALQLPSSEITICHRSGFLEAELERGILVQVIY